MKRQAFPRFYFLADDELLELLSRCRDTSAVQPHLRKCFDAVHSLDFGDGPASNTINAMVSKIKPRLVGVQFLHHDLIAADRQIAFQRKITSVDSVLRFNYVPYILHLCTIKLTSGNSRSTAPMDFFSHLKTEAIILETVDAWLKR